MSIFKPGFTGKDPKPTSRKMNITFLILWSLLAAFIVGSLIFGIIRVSRLSYVPETSITQTV